MIEFTAFPHPVLAVACPVCRKPQGAWCVRPSGHRAMEFHLPRRQAADRAFIAQHGEEAAIQRDEDGQWWISAGA